MTTPALRNPLASLKPVDRAHIAYLACVGGLIVCFRHGVPSWWAFVLAHLAGAALVVALARAATRPASGGTLHFFRTWYHLPVFLLLFWEVHRTTLMIVPRWLDGIILRVEPAVLGVHPTAWLQRLASPWLTEYMSLAYFSYFPLIPAAGAVLLRKRRSDLLERLFFAVALAYYTCYLVFHLMPVEGPAHTLRQLHHVPLQGFAFAKLVLWLESFGGIHGGAFPSAHVAAASVVLVFMVRFGGRAGWVFVPLVLSLDLSTVYLRYHYATDVLGGTLVGLAAAGAEAWWNRRRCEVGVGPR